MTKSSGRLYCLRMSSIQLLPSCIADQIAAGEVVERPASVVKELVENSLDAGATSVSVKIEQGGKKLIEVEDNGSGMSREDGEMSLLRHATSKIHSIDDLFALQTFGFRGEALAAICAVSKFQLLTKTDTASHGTLIKVLGGSNKRVEEAPANTGTTIKIQDLFFATPARLNYLKTDETEYRQIARVITQFALAHPTVSFALSKNDKQTLHFSSANNSQARIQQVLKSHAAHLLPVKSKSQDVQLTGFVSEPGTCARNKTHQYLFVNGRAIEDFRLAHAIREAFVQSAGIEKHLHPMFVLFLTLDPILVDVNVHPRKTEVKFAEPQDVYGRIKMSVMKALQSSVSSPQSSSSFSTPSFAAPPAGAGVFGSPKPPGPKRFDRQEAFAKQLFQQHTPTRHHGVSRPHNIAQNPSLLRQGYGGQAAETPTALNLTLIGQIDNKYIAAQAEKGLYLFDQHALHERQRFEIFWQKYKTESLQSQKLLIAQDINIGEEDVSLLHEHKAELLKLGFEVAFPTDHQIRVTCVPSILAEQELTHSLGDIIKYLREDRVGENVTDQVMRKLLEYKSCRGAVMFGDKLEREEMQKLLDDFQTTQWRNLCPHGRPNHIFLAFEDLNKQFHR